MACLFWKRHKKHHVVSENGDHFAEMEVLGKQYDIHLSYINIYTYVCILYIYICVYVLHISYIGQVREGDDPSITLDAVLALREVIETTGNLTPWKVHTLW